MEHYYNNNHHNGFCNEYTKITEYNNYCTIIEICVQNIFIFSGLLLTKLFDHYYYCFVFPVLCCFVENTLNFNIVYIL